MELFGQKPYWEEERATDSTKPHQWIPMDGSRSEQPAKQYEALHRKEIKAKRPMVRPRILYRTLSRRVQHLLIQQMSHMLITCQALF